MCSSNVGGWWMVDAMRWTLDAGRRSMQVNIVRAMKLVYCYELFCRFDLLAHKNGAISLSFMANALWNFIEHLTLGHWLSMRRTQMNGNEQIRKTRIFHSSWPFRWLWRAEDAFVGKSKNSFSHSPIPLALTHSLTLSDGNFLSNKNSLVKSSVVFFSANHINYRFDYFSILFLAIWSKNAFHNRRHSRRIFDICLSTS